VSDVDFGERVLPHVPETTTAVRDGEPLSPDVFRWDPDRLSKSMVADYKPMTMVDGEGVRCAIYVSGCPLACPGCFNVPAQSFKFGERYTGELEDRILADLAQPYVQGLSLLGGEPFLNTPTMLPLVHRVRRELPTKDIWAWTGLTFEWITSRGFDAQRELLGQIDVLVDGPFIASKKDLTLAYRGSSNQRILDVPASLEAGRAVIWER
jgi:anaerobic ribonucleoside-triphosphate reductase activating protein